jgi:hypothetical protein
MMEIEVLRVSYRGVRCEQLKCNGIHSDANGTNMVFCFWWKVVRILYSMESEMNVKRFVLSLTIIIRHDSL